MSSETTGADSDLERRAERLAEQLRAAGHHVSRLTNAVSPALAGDLLGGLSERTLRAWRRDGEGPRWFQIRRTPYYRLAELIRYMDAKINGHERPNAEIGGK